MAEVEGNKLSVTWIMMMVNQAIGRVTGTFGITEIIQIARHLACPSPGEYWRDYWRCFHCDFVTADPAEAQAHFGDRDDAEEFKPLCKWWATMTADDKIFHFQQALKDLEAERRDNERLRTANEGLQWKADSLELEIKSYKPFRECRTMHDVFNLFDSMEGRALAAESAARRKRRKSF